MNLSDLFELSEVQLRGNEYGWVNTKVDVLPGMPLQIQGTGSINFCNTLGQQWWFTCDGQEGEIARKESLGYGVSGVKHAMLIARIGNGPVFPVGSFLQFQSHNQGPLYLAHNDTKCVSDNDGAWTVRVCVPVQAMKGQRRTSGPGSNPGSSPSALDVQFTGPLGINGQLSVNLPKWIQHPNPRFSLHGLPAHGSNPEKGLMCVETDVPIWGPVRFRRCIHIQL